MHAIRFATPRQLYSRLTAKVRHAEPQMHARRKADRIQAAHRADECARELKEALWGSYALHAGVEL